MSSNEAGSRLPNGRSVPPQFADAHLTENLAVGTFDTAQSWEPFGDDDRDGSGERIINICIDHPTFGVMVLGYMTLGDEPHSEDPIRDARAPASGDGDPTPSYHAYLMGDYPTPGPDHADNPDMQAFADELRRLEPGFTEQDIDDRVKYRFSGGQDQQAGFRQARRWQQDFVGHRETILSILDDAEHARAVTEMLSDRHLVLGAASFAPWIWGAGASFADGALYLREHNYWDAGLSFLAAGFGIVSDAGLIKSALKGVEKAVELGKAAEVASEGSHAAQIASDAARVEKPAAAEAAAAGQASDASTARGMEATAKAAVHGNSKLSPRTAHLYELYSKDGTFLKNGVTQNLDTRYPKAFMKDKDIFPVTSGTRADMLALERQRTVANPGPLNREPWAVKPQGQTIPGTQQ